MLVNLGKYSSTMEYFSYSNHGQSWSHPYNRQVGEAVDSKNTKNRCLSGETEWFWLITVYHWLVVYLPLWKISVSWDDYSQYMEIHKTCSKPPTSFCILGLCWPSFFACALTSGFTFCLRGLRVNQIDSFQDFLLLQKPPFIRNVKLTCA